MDVERIWKEYKIPLLLGGTSFVLITISIILLVKSTQTTAPIEFSSEATVSGVTSGTITVDIEGAVVYPGVFVMPMGARVEDAIKEAGGLTEMADGERIEKTINRAAKLSDGAKLYIPKIGDVIDTTSQDSSDSQVSTSLVSINAASQSELEELSGVGPVTATKIITNRPYHTLEELITKKAMGQALFSKLRDRLSL